MESLETSFQINETEMHYHQAALWLNPKLSAESTRLITVPGQCQWERRIHWVFRGPIPSGPRNQSSHVYRRLFPNLKCWEKDKLALVIYTGGKLDSGTYTLSFS